MSDEKEATGGSQTLLEKKFERILSPFQSFIQAQTTSSVLLFFCTIVALALANSSYVDLYEDFFHTPMGIIFADSQFKMSLLHWINDGLMALFFFLLGLEIKREMLAGELQDFSQTVPVVSAAIGGMIFPAVLFYLLNVDTDTAKGWGIPMATDTAFAVGILALLSSRVPSSAFAFLTALAIIDDIGAMLVIAIFYTDSISPEYLFLGVLTFITLLSFNKLGIRKGWVYLVGGLILWVMLYKSGVHATVAGIIVAFSVPARPKHESDWFIRKTQKLMNKFEKIEKDKSSDGTILGDVTQHRIVENVQEVAKKASTPLRRWEHALERPVALLVLPIFALANAGIPVSPNTLTTIWNDSLAGGIVIGLVIGKSLGIPLLAWVAIYFKLGRLPDNLTLKHVIGIGMLAGMGFTMSIFIADLGFDEPDHLVAAKSGILVASLIAGVSGWLWLRFFCNEEINDTPERDL